MGVFGRSSISIAGAKAYLIWCWRLSIRGDSDKGGQTTRRLQLTNRPAIIAWSHKSDPMLRGEVKLEEAIETWQSFCNCDDPGEKLEKNQNLGQFCSGCAPILRVTIVYCNVHVVITIFLQRLFHCFPICFTQSPWMAHFHQCDLVGTCWGLLTSGLWWTASCLGDFYTVSRIRSWGSCGIGRGANPEVSFVSSFHDCDVLWSLHLFTVAFCGALALARSIKK